LAIDTDGLLTVNASPFWSHQTVLDGQPVGGLARAFVRHHLAAHRLFHLVDLVSLVAVRLTTDGSLARDGRVMMLTLSQTDAVVLLRVDDASPVCSAEEVSASAVDESVGSGLFGILTLQWGVRRVADEAKGLWASFDAHRHNHGAVAALDDSTTTSKENRGASRDIGGDGH
jgi:hypothetical protein